MYRTILLPTDGSEGTERALDHALDLAETWGAALHVLSVVDLSGIPPDVGVERVIEAMEETSEEAVETAVAAARAAGIEDVTGTVDHGTPHRAILDYAEEHDVDLIVMGTHGRTGLERYLIGSVTARVVRLSDAPVLTVRMRGPD